MQTAPSARAWIVPRAASAQLSTVETRTASPARCSLLNAGGVGVTTPGVRLSAADPDPDGPVPLLLGGRRTSPPPARDYKAVDADRMGRDGLDRPGRPVPNSLLLKHQLQSLLCSLLSAGGGGVGEESEESNLLLGAHLSTTPSDGCSLVSTNSHLQSDTQVLEVAQLRPRHRSDP